MSKLSKLNTPMSFQTFLLSHLVILMAGLVFLGWMYYVLNQDQLNTTGLGSYLPVSKPPASFSLNLATPDDQIVVFDPNLLISGETSAKSSVIVSSDDEQVPSSASKDLAFEVNPDGQFSKVFSLSPGLNQLSITAFDQNGNSKTVSRTVFYSQDKL